MITVPIHEGETQGRGQLSFDNCHGITILLQYGERIGFQEIKKK